MMFSEMVAGLARGRMPDKSRLRQRFDMAMTKKMGILRLPSAFWMDDPKINPRADHLFWASLLLLDRERMELARAVLAAEQAERRRSVVPDQEELAGQARELLRHLLVLIGDEQSRESLRRDLERIVPEWLEPEAGDGRRTRIGHGH